MPKKFAKSGQKWKQKKDLQAKSFSNPFFSRKKNRIAFSKFSHFLIVVLVIVIGFCSVYFLFFSPYTQVHEIHVEGVDLYLTEQIRDKVNDQLSKRRFIIFPQNNIFLFNKRESKDRIQSLLSYQSISLDFDNRNILIAITESQGVLKWSSQSGTYLLNKDGEALVRLHEYDPIIEHVNLENNIFKVSLIIESDSRPLVYDKREIDYQVGDSIVDSEWIDKLFYLQEKLKQEIEIPVPSFSVTNLQSKQITFDTIEGWYGMINLDSKKGIEENILRLKVLLDSKYSENERILLDYIDIRNNEKMYIKMKDEKELLIQANE